jgi:alpha-galactosidase
LADIPDDHREMIAFYTNYWIENKETLMNGIFEARDPSGNYPMLSVVRGNKMVASVYQDVVVSLNNSDVIHIINGKMSAGVVVQCSKSLGSYNLRIRNCRGEILVSRSINLEAGLTDINIPTAGLAILEKI